MLGKIIEVVSGLTYGEYLKRNIFDPLELTTTTYCAPHPAGKAQGYQIASGELEAAEFLHPSLAFAAGGICSTAGDLIKWQAALMEGRVVSADSYHKMITPDSPLPSGIQQTYGYGLVVTTFQGRDAILHGGETLGFSAGLIYYPDDDLALVLLANTGATGIDALQVLSSLILLKLRAAP